MNAQDQEAACLLRDLWAAYVRMYGIPVDGLIKHNPEWKALWERTQALTQQDKVN